MFPREVEMVLERVSVPGRYVPEDWIRTKEIMSAFVKSQFGLVRV